MRSISITDPFPHCSMDRPLLTTFDRHHSQREFIFRDRSAVYIYKLQQLIGHGLWSTL